MSTTKRIKKKRMNARKGQRIGEREKKGENERTKKRKVNDNRERGKRK